MPTYSIKCLVCKSEEDMFMSIKDLIAQERWTDCPYCSRDEDPKYCTRVQQLTTTSFDIRGPGVYNQGTSSNVSKK